MNNRTVHRTIEILEGPDNHGRYVYFLNWEDPDGVWTKEKSPDGEVVGYRRGQIFRAPLPDPLPPRWAGKWPPRIENRFPEEE